MNSVRIAYFSIVFGIGTFAVAAFLYLSKTTRLSSSLPIDTDIFASYGSFVGGIVGPIFALVGVLLLIANIARQQDAFIKQQIESRFFQLVEMSRDNSNQIQIRDRSGKKIFLSLVRELYVNAGPKVRRVPVQ